MTTAREQAESMYRRTSGRITAAAAANRAAAAAGDFTAIVASLETRSAETITAYQNEEETSTFRACPACKAEWRSPHTPPWIVTDGQRRTEWREMERWHATNCDYLRWQEECIECQHGQALDTCQVCAFN